MIPREPCAALGGKATGGHKVAVAPLRATVEGRRLRIRRSACSVVRGAGFVVAGASPQTFRNVYVCLFVCFLSCSFLLLAF